MLKKVLSAWHALLKPWMSGSGLNRMCGGHE
jgi:hypothetical protein